MFCLTTFLCVSVFFLFKPNLISRNEKAFFSEDCLCYSLLTSKLPFTLLINNLALCFSCNYESAD